MTSKERVLVTLSHQEADRVPVNYSANGGIDNRLPKYPGHHDAWRRVLFLADPLSAGQFPHRKRGRHVRDSKRTRKVLRCESSHRGDPSQRAASHALESCLGGLAAHSPAGQVFFVTKIALFADISQPYALHLRL